MCVCARMRLNGWISEEWKIWNFKMWNEKCCAFYLSRLIKQLSMLLLFCKIWNMRVLCWAYRTCMDVICPTRNECWKQSFSWAIYMGQFCKEERKHLPHSIVKFVTPSIYTQTRSTMYFRHMMTPKKRNHFNSKHSPFRIFFLSFMPTFYAFCWRRL